MIRAVLDANVFVTAVLTPSAAVLDAWRAERFALLASPPILEEIARVLAYPKIARRHRWSNQRIMAFIGNLGDLAIVTAGMLRLSVIHEDPMTTGTSNVRWRGAPSISSAAIGTF